jgi:hypothetical protein
LPEPFLSWAGLYIRLTVSSTTPFAPFAPAAYHASVTGERGF